MRPLLLLVTPLALLVFRPNTTARMWALWTLGASLDFLTAVLPCDLGRAKGMLGGNAVA